MPFYSFKRKSTGETREVMISIAKISEGYKGDTGNETDWERVYDGQINSIITDTKSRFGK